MESLRSPFKTILNFRDVGQSINISAGSELLKPGRLFRGARPDEASAEERQKLVDEYGIRNIMDLRTTTEHIEQAKKRGAAVPSSAAVPKTEDQAAEPLKIPGVTYHEINFNGSAYSRSLVSQLSWMNFGKLIGLMVTGYRVDAIRILGENVMKERGLVGLATDSIDVCTEEVLQVFEVLSDESNYPLMIHCTQGKDRTGLTVMLVLFLLGVPIKAVNEDYLLSEQELVPERESRLKEILSIGLTEEFASCPPDFVTRVHQHILDKYGSVEEYLLGVGVTREMQDRVRQIVAA